MRDPVRAQRVGGGERVVPAVAAQVLQHDGGRVAVQIAADDRRNTGGEGAPGRTPRRMSTP